MSTTTTNFGWDIPQSSDLVKNGATAIAELGQDIDTTMVDLKGGTSGQILSKASNTDMDFAWVAPTTGDITGVTAGTGISGGGTSGDVTITNSMATAITTAGDLIKGTGSGTFARLGIGSTGQVLTVSGGAPAWATPASGSPSFVGAYAYSQNSTQSIPSATSTTILLPSELFDTDGFHSTSSNTSRMTVPSGKAGKYLITAGAKLGGYTGGYARFRIFQNGTEINNYGLDSGQISALQYSDEYPLLSGNIVVSAAVGDYFEIGYYLQNTTNTTYAFMGFSYLGA